MGDIRTNPFPADVTPRPGDRALSLWQPWASLIPLRIKTIETRGWSTSYRGPLLIHATKRRPDIDDMLVVASNIDAWNAWHGAGYVADDGEVSPGPLGALVARANLVDVLPIVGHGDQIDLSRPYVGWWTGALPGDPDASLNVWEEDEALENITAQAPYGDYRPGRFAWFLEDIEPIDPPIDTRGRQGLWTIPEAVVPS